MSVKSSAQKAQRLFVEAATRLQRGDAAGARRGLQKVSRMAPNSAAVWYNLALSAQHLGLHSKAIREYEKSLRINPNQVDALVNLGLSQKHLGGTDAAMFSVRKAILLESKHPRALNLLGSLLAESGDASVALDCFQGALESDPDNVDARLNLAKGLFQYGDLEQSLAILNPLLGKPFATCEQLELHGQILLALGRYDQVEIALQELKNCSPDEESIWRLELFLRHLQKDHVAVIDIAQKLIVNSPDSAVYWHMLGSAYFEMDSAEDAKACFLKANDLDQENPEYRNNIGLVYASLGDKRNAEKNYRAAIALNKEYTPAYRNMVQMRKFSTLNDSDVEALEALWGRDNLDDDTRCNLAFALGKIYDDCGLYERAFRTYEIGNSIRWNEIATGDFDFDQFLNHFDRIVRALDRPPPVASDISNGCAQPIFILGMTRSGTTLVEQIFCRHPDVTGCGELSYIERAISRLERQQEVPRTYPEDFIHLDKEDFDMEAREYLSQVAHLQKLETSHFTDKMPFNFTHIWLIKALFPNAVIIHCHRHPLDTIISNYFQWFGSEINYVYDLRILAKFYVRYNRLMTHWHRMFPQEIYKVQYEALVADKESQIRQLIRKAGLRWDDACHDSKRSDMTIRTASIWQVRQGIYASSMDRWRRYEPYLLPAIEILCTEGILDSDLACVN